MSTVKIRGHTDNTEDYPEGDIGIFRNNDGVASVRTCELGTGIINKTGLETDIFIKSMNVGTDDPGVLEYDNIIPDGVGIRDWTITATGKPLRIEINGHTDDGNPFSRTNGWQLAAGASLKGGDLKVETPSDWPMLAIKTLRYVMENGQTGNGTIALKGTY
jgi:hypothetical protein